MWGKISWWLRFTAVAWAACIGIGAALQAKGVIPETPDLEATVWVVSLGILAVDNVGTLAVRSARSKRIQRRERLEKALMVLLIQMAQTEQVRFEELGASVYVGSPLNWLRRRRSQPDKLKRIHRFRPSQTPQQSGIEWTSATGVVGACWTSQVKQCRNLHPVAKKYEGQALTPEQFTKVSSAARAGFDVQQFNAIAGKYSEVYAEPIWHPKKDRRLIGVMTIDRAFKSVGATFRAEFERNGLTGQSALTAMVIANTLQPARAE